MRPGDEVKAAGQIQKEARETASVVLLFQVPVGDVGPPAWESRMQNKKPITTEARYLTLAEAGAYLGGRSAEAMRMMARHGHIPVAKLGGRIFIDRREIDKLIQDSRISAA